MRSPSVGVNKHQGTFLSDVVLRHAHAVIQQHSLRLGTLERHSLVVLPVPLKEVRKTSGIAANFLRAIARSNTTSMMRSHGGSFVDGAVPSHWLTGVDEYRRSDRWQHVDLA